MDTESTEIVIKAMEYASAAKSPSLAKVGICWCHRNTIITSCGQSQGSVIGPSLSVVDVTCALNTPFILFADDARQLQDEPYPWTRKGLRGLVELSSRTSFEPQHPYPSAVSGCAHDAWRLATSNWPQRNFIKCFIRKKCTMLFKTVV